MEEIMKPFTTAGLVGAALAFTTLSSFAMPISRPAAPVDVTPQDVRLVCDRYGRCYQTRSRYRAVQPYAPRYYGAGPGYYGHGPGYGYAPGYRSGPSIGFSFGVGPRW
jgi:hypothetical protein